MHVLSLMQCMPEVLAAVTTTERVRLYINLFPSNIDGLCMCIEDFLVTNVTTVKFVILQVYIQYGIAIPYCGLMHTL